MLSVYKILEMQFNGTFSNLGINRGDRKMCVVQSKTGHTSETVRDIEQVAYAFQMRWKSWTLDDLEGQQCIRNCIGCSAFSLATAGLSCYLLIMTTTTAMTLMITMHLSGGLSLLHQTPSHSPLIISLLMSILFWFLLLTHLCPPEIFAGYARRRSYQKCNATYRARANLNKHAVSFIHSHTSLRKQQPMTSTATALKSKKITTNMVVRQVIWVNSHG